jgi:hypothetical protein
MRLRLISIHAAVALNERIADRKMKIENRKSKIEMRNERRNTMSDSKFTVMPNGEWLCEILQDGPEKYPILDTVMPDGKRLGEILSGPWLKLVTVDGQRVD